MKTLLAAFGMLVLFVGTGPLASAQQAPAEYLFVVTITVEPGQGPVFEEYERRLRDARERTGDDRSVSVYQNRMGGPLNQYRIVIGFDDYAEVESWPTIPELLTEAYGEDEGERIRAAGAAAIAAVDNQVRAFQRPFSSGLDIVGEGRFFQVVTTEVDMALTRDYEAMLESLKAAEDQRGVRRIRRAGGMGAASVYTVARQLESLGDLFDGASPPQLLREVHGEGAGQGIWDRAQAAVLHRTIEVIELREDLSYAPE